MTRIVAMRDHAPLVLKKDEMESDTVAICRCGLSADWPMCNGTHKATKNEEPNVVYQYSAPEKGDSPSRTEFEGDASAADPRPWTAEEEAERTS